MSKPDLTSGALLVIALPPEHFILIHDVVTAACTSQLKPPLLVAPSLLLNVHCPTVTDENVQSGQLGII